MSEEEVREIALEVFNDQLNKTQFDVSSVPFHTHNQIDSPKLAPTSVKNFVALPATNSSVVGQSGVIATNNIGLAPAPFGIVYPVPIIRGYGPSTFSQFNGGIAPLGSTIVFMNPGIPLYQIWVRTEDGVGNPIWAGVDLPLTA